MAEAETNLAINVIPGLSDSYEVQGRGELQLGNFFFNFKSSPSNIFHIRLSLADERLDCSCSFNRTCIS